MKEFVAYLEKLTPLVIFGYYVQRLSMGEHQVYFAIGWALFATLLFWAFVWAFMAHTR